MVWFWDKEQLNTSLCDTLKGRVNALDLENETSTTHQLCKRTCNEVTIPSCHGNWSDEYEVDIGDRVEVCIRMAACVNEHFTVL